MGRTKQLRRLLAWLWGLRKDKRWVENTKISTALWILNFGLFYIGVTSFTSNTWLTNLVLSLSWDVVWYFINRFHLWKERDVTTGVSASYSAGAWLFFFVLNQKVAPSAKEQYAFEERWRALTVPPSELVQRDYQIVRASDGRSAAAEVAVAGHVQRGH